MKAGLQMYTLRDFCKTPEDVGKTLERVSKIGYRVIQNSAMEGIQPKELKKVADENGLSICSSHIGYDRLIGEIEKVIEEHKILGCEAVICPGLLPEQHNREGYEKVAQELTKILPRIKKSGLTLGYHNHGIEFEKYDGKTGLDILLGNCPGLEAEIDTYWVQYGGGDPAFWIERFSGRVSETHFKDMGIKDNLQVQPPIGEGNLNWEKILSSCRKAGVRYCLVEMDKCTIEPFECVRISLENLKSWGLE